MEQITIKQLKNKSPRAAERLESYFNRQEVEFVDERANILIRDGKHIRCRVKGGAAWHRIDWNSKSGTWKPHARES